jgi:hypothetical protein
MLSRTLTMPASSLMALIVICGCSSAANGPNAADSATSTTPISPVVLPDGGTLSDAEVTSTDSGVQPTECNPIQPYIADTTHVACPPGDSCGFVQPDQDQTNCGPSGMGVQGTGCNGQEDCIAGYDCVMIGQHGSCARFCRVGATFDDCGSEYACTAFLAPADDGSQEVGVCL